MTVDVTVLIPLLFIVAIGSYIQAVVGFAFGLIFLGLSASIDLLPIPTIAILISLLALVNTATALYGNYKKILWPQVLVVLVVGLPMIWIGIMILDYLSGNNVKALRFALGVTIFLCAFTLLQQPKTDAQLSSTTSFGIAGMFGGLLGGMFATSGPPLVFQFYRQPLSMEVIRDSLLAIFLFSSFSRTTLVVLNGAMDQEILILAVIAFPVVILFTRLARRFPPKLSEKLLRRIVFALLALSSLTLMVS
ncbi:MAG: sulfite exporter TauE/SafE family protein [Rhodospirillales bacterium]|nr:sulfite exporter TauE/SafE family protein [Rhodospirillales bacterium]